jgi:hypothetical protein
MTAEIGRQAVERDAATHLIQLRADRRRLWADRDDPEISLELHRIISDIRACEDELGLNRRRHPARNVGR